MSMATSEMAFVSGLVLLNPTDLYNMLNQEDPISLLSDDNYLLLLDARLKCNYNESHIVTAKLVSKNELGEFVVPYESELECRQNVVVYDGHTSSLDDEEGAAITCAKVMWNQGSRNPVLILKGGYEDFSSFYPFLRTQKIIYMPRELDPFKTYPLEIIPGFLYLGNWSHGNMAYIQKDLRIKGHINCCMEDETFFNEEGPHLLNVKVDDVREAELLPHFDSTCNFIDSMEKRNEVVLVFSKRGISRSVTIVIAYLIQHYGWTLKRAYEHVQHCCGSMRPNRGFVLQLSIWEETVLGLKQSDCGDPHF